VPNWQNLPGVHTVIDGVSAQPAQSADTPAPDPPGRLSQRSVGTNRARYQARTRTAAPQGRQCFNDIAGCPWALLSFRQKKGFSYLYISMFSFRQDVGPRQPGLGCAKNLSNVQFAGNIVPFSVLQFGFKTIRLQDIRVRGTNRGECPQTGSIREDEMPHYLYLCCLRPVHITGNDPRGSIAPWFDKPDVRVARATF